MPDDITKDIKMKHYFFLNHILKGYKYIGRCSSILETVLNSQKAAKRAYYTGIILKNKYKPRLMWKCLKELLAGKSKA